MAVNPLALAVGLPIASKIFATGKQVGQKIFSDYFEPNGSNAISLGDAPAMGEQLTQLANQLQSWLSDHGISTPFDIDLRTDSISNESSVEVSGPDRNNISQLLQENPAQLEGLKKFASSLQALANSLGRTNTSISISDLGSSFSY